MTAFRDLPTMTRRSFEAFLQRFQDEHPGSNLTRVDDGDNPIFKPSGFSGYSIAFQDVTSGVRYRAQVGDNGDVEAVRI